MRSSLSAVALLLLACRPEVGPPDPTQRDSSPDTAPIDTAPIDTAPIDTAPIDTAPTDTAPTDTAVTHPSPVSLDFDGFIPQNFVIIHVDTLRADALARWGSPHATTPLLDARPGWMAVERALSTATWTAPATASLFTGLDLPTHGVRFFDENGPNHLLTEMTYPEHLGSLGFVTNLITGSEVVLDDGAYDLGHGFQSTSHVDNEPGNAAAIVDEALEWTQSLALDQPFLLFLQPMDAHGPYAPTTGDLGTWADLSAVPFDLSGYPGEQEAQINFALAEAASDAERLAILAQVRNVYDEQLLGVDRAIETLMEGLSATGQLDRTIVVFTADHGESFYDGLPAHLGHGMYTRNEIVRVPLLFWTPVSPTGSTACVASNIDVFPTLLDAAGLTDIAGVEGQSLLGGCREVAFSAEYHADGGIETLDYLSGESLAAQVVYGCATGSIQAFDLLMDPGARNPRRLADVPAAGAVADALDLYSASVLATLSDLSCTIER